VPESAALQYFSLLQIQPLTKFVLVTLSVCFIVEGMCVKMVPPTGVKLAS
jgi:hypothetical protein